MQNNKKIWEYVLKIFFGWRSILIIVTFFGLSLIAKATMVDYKLDWPSTQTNYWIQWANWDGGHFLGIAENGYLPIQTPFFPLYPLLIYILKFIGIPTLFAGLFITHISTIIALFYLYKLVSLDYSERIAKKTLIALLIFPTSFYLGSVYSEPLFLALTVSAFYYARQGKILTAAALGGLSFATRIIGIATIAGIFIEYLFNNKDALKNYFSKNTLIKRSIIYALSAYFILYFLSTQLLKAKLWFWVASLVIVNNLILIFIFLTISIYLLIFLYSITDFKKIFDIKFIYLLLSIIPFFYI